MLLIFEWNLLLLKSFKFYEKLVFGVKCHLLKFVMHVSASMRMCASQTRRYFFREKDGQRQEFLDLGMRHKYLVPEKNHQKLEAAVVFYAKLVRKNVSMEERQRCSFVRFLKASSNKILMPRNDLSLKKGITNFKNKILVSRDAQNAVIEKLDNEINKTKKDISNLRRQIPASQKENPLYYSWEIR